MGSGSFGGGSGSFGGGGSGGGGGRGRTGGGGGSQGGSGGRGGGGSGTDSAHERILKLTKLTDALNATPELLKVKKQISDMLKDRTRLAFLRSILEDPVIQSAYTSLLSIEVSLRDGSALPAAIAQLGGTASATLADLADLLCSSAQTADTDERVDRIVRRAVRELLLKTVKNNHELYYETSLDTLGSKFSSIPLANTADRFLGEILTGTVRGDLLNLDKGAASLVGEASHQIAVAWTDRFGERAHKKGVPFKDMMGTLASDLTSYVGTEQ